MEKNSFLKIVPFPKLTPNKLMPADAPLTRFSAIVLNLTSNALECVQQLARKEMAKKSPSADMMEDYYLLHHYLDIIRKICLEKRA